MGGRIVGRVTNLPQNTLKIEKTPDFGHFILEFGGSTHPVFKSAGVRTPDPPSATPLRPAVGFPNLRLWIRSLFLCESRTNIRIERRKITYECSKCYCITYLILASGGAVDATPPPMSFYELHAKPFGVSC